MTDKQSDFQAAYAAGNAYMIPQRDITVVTQGETPYVVVPNGYSVQDTERFAAHPVRTRHTVECQNVDTFVAYYTKFMNDDSVILANKNAAAPSFKVIFDFDSPGRPAWKTHTAVYRCPYSIEWGVWSTNDKKPMQQEAFAQFIEENLTDIVHPDHATMLEVSRSLVARRNVDFVESVRLDNGARQFTYHEEIKGATSKGMIEVPEMFAVGIPVFVDEPRVAIEARLRYRIPDGGGTLLMWYELVRPLKVIEAAFADVVNKIKERTQSEILFGTIS